MTDLCPVCGYTELAEPPDNWSICPCCGTEFEYDDFDTDFSELRTRWLAAGAPWFDDQTPIPYGWDAFAQLAAAGFIRSTARQSGEDVEEVDLGQPTAPGILVESQSAFLASSGLRTEEVPYA